METTTTNTEPVQHVFKCGGLKKLTKEYNEIPNRQLKKKRDMEYYVYKYLFEKVGWGDTGFNHVFLYMFHRVPGSQDIYKKWTERQERQKKENEEYEANLKPIEEVLVAGDIILDDEEECEWVVLEVNEHGAVVKKRRGKKELDIQYIGDDWEEVLEVNDDGEYPDRDPIYFTQMFIKV